MNKFGARKTGCSQGHMHDSAKEATRCNELHLLQKGGVISHLVIAPQYWFQIGGEQLRHDNGRRVGMKLDFAYIEAEHTVVEDVKGGKATKTEAYTLRKAIFRALYPFIQFREV